MPVAVAAFVEGVVVVADGVEAQEERKCSGGVEKEQEQKKSAKG